jgi:hypothetical protein
MVLYWTAETAKYGLLSTLSFSNNNSQSSKLCAECAKFQIRVDAGEPDEVGLIFMAAQHRLRQEHEDIFPIFPNMKKRAAHGCTFAHLSDQAFYQSSTSVKVDFRHTKDKQRRLFSPDR